MQRNQLLIGAIVAMITGNVSAQEVYDDPIDAADSRDFLFQGEYVGEIRTEDGREPVSLQVRALGEQEFEVVAYEGQLPGIASEVPETLRVEGRRQGWNLEIQHPEKPFHAVIQPGFASVYTEEDQRIGLLQRTVRRSPTLRKKPPEEAVVLFDGSSVDAWRGGAEMTADGLLKEGATTEGAFGDVYLHLEYRCPYMPKARGQGRGNSGVYLQNRYEVQVLDSFGNPPRDNEAGGLYSRRKPDLNMSLPPLNWQTYDIWFQAPTFNDDGEKTANALVTVKHNGVVIHDKVELSQGTGGGANREEVEEGPLHLQDHGTPVRYRNVWLVEDPQ